MGVAVQDRLEVLRGQAEVVEEGEGLPVGLMEGEDRIVAAGRSGREITSQKWDGLGDRI